MRIVSTPAGWKPRSIRCSDHNVRSIRPAPMRRTTASAISATTSALRKRRRPPPVVALPPPSFMESVRSDRRMRAAGARLKTTVVRSAMTTVKTRTRQSTVLPDTRGMLGGFQSARIRMPIVASARPATALTDASTRLSVSNWRTTRAAPAPRAVRTAISRWRASARASSRFATLAHAISSRNPTAPNSSQMVRRTPPTTSSRSENASVSNCICCG